MGNVRKHSKNNTKNNVTKIIVSILVIVLFIFIMNVMLKEKSENESGNSGENDSKDTIAPELILSEEKTVVAIGETVTPFTSLVAVSVYYIPLIE